MAVKLSTVVKGDKLYYPLSTRPGEAYDVLVVSVAPDKKSAVIRINGRERTVTQTNFNRYRRSPPKRHGNVRRLRPSRRSR